MADDKGFRRMSELVAALAAAERGLSSGALDIAGVDSACVDARELYERLVVLRHKAREGKPKRQEQGQRDLPPAGHPELSLRGSEKQSEGTAPAAPTIRLDTRPPDAPRQTSLIEAIEASEEKPAKPVASATRSTSADKPSPAGKSSTLAEKMERASIPDLAKAISLSHKFWFVAELFNGDRITYEKSIDKLNTFASHASAQAFIDTEVIARLKKPADAEALATFTELVQRRYT